MRCTYEATTLINLNENALAYSKIVCLPKFFNYNLFHNEGIGGGGHYKTQHKETSLNYCKVPVFV